MARLDLPDPRRDEDTATGALPSADFRARQRIAARDAQAPVVYAAAYAQGKAGALADRVRASREDIPDALLYALAGASLHNLTPRQLRLGAEA